MPICTHLTSEKHLSHILRTGIKAQSMLALNKDIKGVYCMPLLPNYYVSHQWLREIKRGSGHANLIAIDFRLPSNEIVLVGHYSQAKSKFTISAATKLIMTVEDPLGYEIFLPRSVKTSEIQKVRSVPQIVGWRYHPKAKGTEPCTCDCCIRGQYGANKLRERFSTGEEQAVPKAQIMAILKHQKDTDALCSALYSLGTKKRSNAEELEFLLDHPSLEVLSALAMVLEFYRGKKATAMLMQLSNHTYKRIRQEANASLLSRKGEFDTKSNN